MWKQRSKTDSLSRITYYLVSKFTTQAKVSFNSQPHVFLKYYFPYKPIGHLACPRFPYKPFTEPSPAFQTCSVRCFSLRYVRGMRVGPEIVYFSVGAGCSQVFSFLFLTEYAFFFIPVIQESPGEGVRWSIISLTAFLTWMLGITNARPKLGWDVRSCGLTVTVAGDVTATVSSDDSERRTGDHPEQEVQPGSRGPCTSAWLTIASLALFPSLLPLFLLLQLHLLPPLGFLPPVSFLLPPLLLQLQLLPPKYPQAPPRLVSRQSLSPGWEEKWLRR